MTELDEAIYDTKNKASSPGKIPAEISKLPDTTSRLHVPELFNSSFTSEQQIPIEAQLAKVVLI